MLTIEQITGLDSSHLVSVTDARGRHYLEAETAVAFRELQAEASKSGIEIVIASGHRGFARQKVIWDAKARGERTILDSEGKALECAELSKEELVMAMMRWSAMPGASRHHWGSDFDIYDAQAVPAGYQLQLVPEEYGPGGVFNNLTRWLDERWARGLSEDFFRPYDRDRGGVAPELWHISYRPVATLCQQSLTVECLSSLLRQHEIALGDYCIDNLDSLYRRFIINVYR
ncbi:LAS superfamily LD-carboxypeptidase LdcB [Sinobacterium caligoides]|uniref:LAS superfamily LD-carboxypeptidase LdcB n=1 Tax=Sinobacterium caligoides TaxID=933926 RepID=A0A3N2E1Y1_9GAMM|nr:M15 family metallopeptidase [Sinobacterium caligoides]ROS06123.1 LAS superfamily LD-carboxypeptidase LdcB [Sinobacterium caligoides]